MSDAYLDSIKEILVNGEVPTSVTNKMLLAGLQVVDRKLGAVIEKQGELDERVDKLEHYRTRASTWGAAIVLFWSVLITILNLWVL